MRGALTTWLSHHQRPHPMRAGRSVRWSALGFTRDGIAIDRNPRRLAFLFDERGARHLAYDRAGVRSQPGDVWRMRFTGWPEASSHAIWVLMGGSENAPRVELFAGEPETQFCHDVESPDGTPLPPFWMASGNNDATPCVLGFGRFMEKLELPLTWGRLVPIYFTLDRCEV